MPVCSNCKAEYIRGKKICSFCGQELYRGLLTDLSEDEKIFEQIEWTKILSVNSQQEADIVIKQLYIYNIPALKRDAEIPFMDVTETTPLSIDIYVPASIGDKAMESLN
ncbi:MAG: hypothetical protein ACM3KR_06645 [Deltaproteobacteria bacterium]